MKRILFTLLAISTLLIISSINSFAGTLHIGARGFYTFWDSGIAKMNAQIVENQIQKEMTQAEINIANFGGAGGLTVDDPTSSGYVLGPVIGYTTTDKKWSFKGDFMFLGQYTTDIGANVAVTANLPIIGTTTQNLPISSELAIEHTEINLEARRKLTDLFSVFAGYRYPSYTSQIEADYSLSVVAATISSDIDFKLNADMHMLFAGVGIEKSFNSVLSLKANLGAGLPVAGSVEQDLKVSSNFFNEDISSDGGEIKMALLGFADIAIDFKVSKSVILQLGYQFRYLTVDIEKLDMYADGTANDSASETDIFQGITFKAEYQLAL